METTLNQILKHNPCGQGVTDEEGWRKLLNYLGKTEPDNEPLSLLTILESNGFEDALWALRTVEGYDREIKLFTCWCACQALPAFEHRYPENISMRYCIEISALYAEGLEGAAVVKDAARVAARDAAWGVARVAAWEPAWDAARIAARDAAWGVALEPAWDAARVVARNAAWGVARVVAWDAARDATPPATWDAAWSVAWSAAWAAARGVQKEEFIKLCQGGKDYMKLII